ncbi:5277_t:CDS:2, partial [Acaulospora morrowiae]
FVRSYPVAPSNSRSHRSGDRRREEAYHRHRHGRDHDRDGRRSIDYNNEQRRSSPSYDKTMGENRETENETQQKMQHSDKPIFEKEAGKETNKTTKPKVPISLEELLQKHETEKQANDRPKFMTKEEREKLALEKRQKEIEEKRLKQDEERRQQEEFQRRAMEEARQNGYGRDRRDYYDRYERERFDRYDRSRGRDRDNLEKRSTDKSEATEEEKLDDKELQAIR